LYSKCSYFELLSSFSMQIFLQKSKHKIYQ